MPFLKERRKRAICYYRHSREEAQENSVTIQREQVAKFAAYHNIEIIHEEADEGVSGLTGDRPAFKRVFTDWVANPDAPDFEYVLVLNVSRWGRFQDLDEAGAYEMEVKKYGKLVIYSDQGFPKEGEELTNAMTTAMKRVGAADQSKKLSVDVFYGALKVSEQGYSAGGSPPMGLSRLLLSETREPIQVLKPGERKMISNQRVTGISTGDQYSEMVEQMFMILEKSWYRPDQIAAALNEKGMRSPKGKLWTASMVVEKLSNEKYAGSQVYNKTWGKLKKKQRTNPKEEWIITPNAFTGIISREVFLKAQGQLYWMLASRWRRGIRAVERMRRTVLQELDELITSEGTYTEEERWILLRNFPLTCSVTLSRTTKPQWCFTIPDHLKKFSHVLAIGINPYKKESMAERYFLLPTSLFAIGNFHVVTSNDASYTEYLASPDQLEDDAKELSKQILSLRSFL